MKNLIKSFFVLLVVGALTGCTYQESVVDIDTTTESIFEVNENGEVTGNELCHDVDVDGEVFKLNITYSLGDYNFDNWMVTDNKTVRFVVKTVDAPEDTEVFVEHVHADISIKSRLQKVNGVSQDSMDDSFHGVSQDGFYIDNNIAYNEVFAIEGYNDTFFSLYGHCWNGYGSISGSEKRLSEELIVKDGECYAQKLSVVFDLLIKNAEDKYFHTTAVVDEVLIPVKYNGKTEERDLQGNAVKLPNVEPTKIVTKNAEIEVDVNDPLHQ